MDHYQESTFLVIWACRETFKIKLTKRIELASVINTWVLVVSSEETATYNSIIT